MAQSFGLSGQQQFANLSRVLKGTDLRKGYLAGIRKATAPAKTVVPESARSTLPRRGGLNEHVASSLKVASRTSLSGPEASVRIVATEGPKRRIRDLNNGVDRHPVFGNRKAWATTRVQPGFFTRPMVAMAPACRRQIVAETNNLLRQIAAS